MGELQNVSISNVKDRPTKEGKKGRIVGLQIAGDWYSLYVPKDKSAPRVGTLVKSSKWEEEPSFDGNATYKTIKKIEYGEAPASQPTETRQFNAASQFMMLVSYIKDVKLAIIDKEGIPQGTNLAEIGKEIMDAALETWAHMKKGD